MPAPGPVAQVAVNARLRASTVAFDYAVPPALDLRVGHLVWVPFGRRRVQGVVVGFADATSVDAAALKTVDGLVEPLPVLHDHQVALARWLAERYRASLLACLLLMLPPALQRRGRGTVELVDQPLLPSLDEAGQRVVASLRARGPVDEDRLRAGLRRVPRLDGALATLEASGVIRRTWTAPPPAAAKRALYLRVPRRLDLAALVEEAGAGPRARVAAALNRLLSVSARLAPAGPAELLVPASQVRAQARVTLATIRSLTAEGWFELEERAAARRPAIEPVARPDVTLTPEQAAAVGQIAATVGRGGAFLLHGVTGSGKTEVYLRLVEHALAAGRGAMVLVPEIALEPQMAARVAAAFPGRVALLHSGLTDTQRLDEWRRVRDGSAAVVVGARSALFAPLPAPGLIVLDEAHEWTYKQAEPAPRYHARDAALRLAELTGATVVFGSATPDIETYARALDGEIQPVALPDRVPAGPAVAGGPPNGSAPRVGQVRRALPAVQVVDMRAEAVEGRWGPFSRRLEELLRETLERREQAILFLNRRGSSPIVQCRSCGRVVECRGCGVSFVFHADVDALVCHQCNRHATVPDRCPDCWRTEIAFIGVGTQRVEAEVERLLPTARVVRWDRDTAAGRSAHARLHATLTRGEADVVVGTQMIAKGLDLPRVTLVGVVSADTALHLPDFRAAERTFQLLAQVAGRAGRGDRPGRVVIQTHSPDHYAIRAAAAHDYAAFAREELTFRRDRAYPPFSRLVRLLYCHSNPERCRQETESEAARLRAGIGRLGLTDVDLLGPAPAFRRLARGLHRWHIVLRAADLEPVVAQLGLPEERPVGRHRVPLGWSVDVDPVSLL